VRKGFQKKKGKRQMPMCLFHFSFVSLNPEAFISRSKELSVDRVPLSTCQIGLKDSGLSLYLQPLSFLIKK